MSMERVKERVLNEEYTRRFETVADHIPYAYQMGVELIELVKQQNEWIGTIKEHNIDMNKMIREHQEQARQKDQRIEKLQKKLQASRESVLPLSEENDELRYQNNQKDQRIEELEKENEKLWKWVKQDDEPLTNEELNKLSEWIKQALNK